MTTTAEIAPPGATATARLHWIITLQAGGSRSLSVGTIAGADTFTAGGTRAQVFNWAIGNAARQLAVADPAFRDGPYVVLFFSLERDEL